MGRCIFLERKRGQKNVRIPTVYDKDGEKIAPDGFMMAEKYVRWKKMRHGAIYICRFCRIYYIHTS